MCKTTVTQCHVDLPAGSWQHLSQLTSIHPAFILKLQPDSPVPNASDGIDLPRRSGSTTPDGVSTLIRLDIATTRCQGTPRTVLRLHAMPASKDVM